MRTERLAYLGDRYTHTYAAALKFAAKTDELVGYHTIFQSINAALGGECDYAVAPIENSCGGSVTDTLDALRAYPLFIRKETVIHVPQHLIGVAGADKNSIRTIYSHPQALGQCAKFIRSRFPHAELIHTSSTSACLGLINSPSDAGIIGMQPVDDRFELSSESIADEPANYTQFLYVVRGGPDPSRHTNKIFLSFTCEHRPGTLLGALSVFAGAGVNLTRIESRPIKEEHPSAEELKDWWGRSGLPLKRFFNTSGNLYKELHLKDRLPEMSEQEQIDLLATDGMLVKRPLLVTDQGIFPGFREQEWEKLLGEGAE